MNHDPTRIPPLLELLHRVWEAQPDRRFVDILTQLEFEGMTPASSDDDVAHALAVLLERFPDAVPLTDHGTAAAYMLRTSGSDVTVDGETIIVRPRTPQRGAPPPRPSVWQYSSLSGTHVSTVLRARDLEGMDHCLGMVEQIRPLVVPTAVSNGPARAAHMRCESLPALERATIDDRIFIIDLELPQRAASKLAGTKTADSGDTAAAALTARFVLGRAAHIYTQGRRHLDVDTVRWEKVPATGIGEELVVTLGAGAGRYSCGTVTAVYCVST